MIICRPSEWNHLRISLLHLALRPGALESNKALVKQGVCRAASLGSEWIVTPELCISGYQFMDTIGTNWIEPHPDNATTSFCALAKLYQVVIFLGHIERDQMGRFYNCSFMLDSNGEIVGHHRKINIAAESWSSAGSIIEPAYTIRRRRDGRAFEEGFHTRNSIASYVHAHWASNPVLARTLVDTCAHPAAGGSSLPSP